VRASHHAHCVRTAIAMAFVAALPQSARGAPIVNEVMLVNAKTAKCATIAGGVTTDNNVPSVQFDCDSDPSRRWTLTKMAQGVVNSDRPEFATLAA
jgi:hypothetical protein